MTNELDRRLAKARAARSRFNREVINLRQAAVLRCWVVVGSLYWVVHLGPKIWGQIYGQISKGCSTYINFYCLGFGNMMTKSCCFRSNKPTTMGDFFFKGMFLGKFHSNLS